MVLLNTIQPVSPNEINDKLSKRAKKEKVKER